MESTEGRLKGDNLCGAGDNGAKLLLFRPFPLGEPTAGAVPGGERIILTAGQSMSSRLSRNSYAPRETLLVRLSCCA
jgi:hypothetical protein